MNRKKLIAGYMAATLLSMSAIGVAADTTNDPIDVAINEALKQDQDVYFGMFSGRIKSIAPAHMEGSKMVLVENEEGQEANLIVSESTYVLDDIELKEGDLISGYYEAGLPMITIYPPQYSTQVIVGEIKESNVKVAHFNEHLTSDDNTLKLNLSKDIIILTEDGNAYEGQLENKKLIVTYDVSTRSISAQTTPSRIIVLSEEETDKIEEAYTASSKEVILNGTILEEELYTNQAGTLMLPLRMIGESLGYAVEWEQETSSVYLGKDISLTIDDTTYHYMKMAPITLEAPKLIENMTYVPLSFFDKVMGAEVVEEDQQIVINLE